MATLEEMDRWRRDLQQLHTLLLDTREQFTAWKEELDITQGVVETDEFQNYVTEIKIDLQQGRQLLAQLPNVEEFTEEEIEKKIGKVGQLLNIGEQVTTLQTQLPRKMEKLQFLAKQRLQ
jgi:hypothetical protein